MTVKIDQDEKTIGDQTFFNNPQQIADHVKNNVHANR